jgi:hypothetical protein
LNRLDNARREVNEKQKRLNWNIKNNLKTNNHFRSSSMEELNAEVYKKQESSNALISLKKNLRDELSSIVMMPQDSEGEY